MLVWRLDLTVASMRLLYINEVVVRRARLVLGWVTIFGGHTTLVYLPSHLGQLSLLPPAGRENEYRPKGGDALRLGR